ncbi:hypothetical protein A2Z33_03025 [Candidatus Gottesmanbacteria bacterium RBG_16_52_11]|uniref:Large ribosomal subunit protein bL25 n=1 Tax=Candidatus Gottesmanbacteria bacterium RBG_16_52_11 TaxID=1798374 RepID=A0A1F5YV63_9BACT|nr:MAG: hypothetical protein A2Z33_03025 [Candidatus Gottesmanbacteria bacterium RBG_16_52_11]
MKHYTLKSEIRQVTGRKVKVLRKSGKLPATVYGKKVKSASLTLNTEEFLKIYADAKETGLIDLTVGSDKKPVLIHSVQTDPVTRNPLHVEFHQVDLKEKVRANVPIVITGTPAAVDQKVGMLLTLLDEVEVEALPAELPDKIEVDVSTLSEIDQEMTVAVLKVPAGVTMITDPGIAVVKIGALVTKEAEIAAAPPPPEEVALAGEVQPSAEEGTEMPGKDQVPHKAVTGEEKAAD